ncbi:hypothetical protein RCC89_18010 [Cytophagaceae bacterium ABcell3]|nr:hypothetical protein RCC89_18010 [Cytophagaceae bacterium ABcell3]
MADKIKNYPFPSYIFEGDAKIKACEISDFLKSKGVGSDTNENISVEVVMNLKDHHALRNNSPSVNRHLIPTANGWGLLDPGTLRFLPLSGTRKEIIRFAKSIAKLEKYKLFIHAANGLVSDCVCFRVNMPYASMRESLTRRAGWV